MTREEILEGNKLIAEWLGYELESLSYLNDNDEVRYFVDDHNVECIADGIDTWETTEEDWTAWLTPLQMKFHSSWDWLMPVVEKIESINITDENYYAVNIRHNECCIECCDDDYWIAHVLPNQSKLLSTFKAIIEFIKWYNLNNK